MDSKYILTLTKEQSDIIAKACRFYADIRIGNFEEIITHTADHSKLDEEKKARAKNLLYEARKHIMPKLEEESSRHDIKDFPMSTRMLYVSEMANACTGELILTKDEAHDTYLACEFYARMKYGQYEEIIYHMLDIHLDGVSYCERRDCAENFLFAARKILLPELHGRGHSYGIGKFDDADTAYDVYQVIRVHFGDPRSPFSFHELPKCVKA